MAVRKGKPNGAIVSPERLEEIERIKARGFAVIDEMRARNADKDQEQIDRDVMAAVEAVRREKHAERKAVDTSRS